MKISVEQFKFNKGEIREVEIPNGEIDGNLNHDLDLVFHYGQNDILRVPGKPSVSVGDVIDWYGRKYAVIGIGFEDISGEKYDAIKQASDSTPKDEMFMRNFRNALFVAMGNESFKYI